MNPIASLPNWIFFVVGGSVAIFGLYRLKIGFRSEIEEEDAKKRGGLFARGRRVHLLYGLVYLVLGVMLVATGFGYKPPWVR
jgi:hypothetical protein